MAFEHIIKGQGQFNYSLIHEVAAGIILVRSSEYFCCKKYNLMTGIYRLSHKTCNEGKNKYNKIYRRKKLKYRVKIWRKTAFWVLS